jgi:hypothetical protein
MVSNSTIQFFILRVISSAIKDTLRVNIPCQILAGIIA